MNSLEILKIRVRPILSNDIIDFYPIISKEVFIESIYYAKNDVEITDKQYQINLACRKTVLTNNDSTL